MQQQQQQFVVVVVDVAVAVRTFWTCCVRGEQGANRQPRTQQRDHVVHVDVGAHHGAAAIKRSNGILDGHEPAHGGSPGGDGRE